MVLKPVNTNGNNFEVRTKDNDVVVSFTQNAPGNSSSYDLFTAILSTATNEDGEVYNIVARFTKDENWDAKLNIFANAGSSGASFDITIPPDAYGNIAMASDLEPLKTSIGNKQDTLVSGTNIKTINGESILGSGNITISGGSGSGRPPLYSHTITLKKSGNSAYFTFTIYMRTDEEITKDRLFYYLNWEVCAGTGVASNALIDKITFSTRADNTWVHQFLELSGQHIDKELAFDSVFGTDFTVEDAVRGPDWIPPR